MVKLIIILLIALIFEAIGVVCLSGGLKQIGGIEHYSVSELAGLLKRGATNQRILLGVFFEAIFFGALLYLLSQRDVSLVWPLTSISFVLTSLAARFFLHEFISPMRWAGIVLIMAGAALISYSEKSKSAVPPAAAVAVSEE